MLTLSVLLAFVAASLAQNLSIGPNTLFTLNLSIGQGRRAGVVAVLGGAAARLLHTLAATLGLSALLAGSALAYGAVKELGAAYLIYLGVRSLLARRGPAVTASVRQASHGQTSPVQSSDARLFSQGLWVTLLNPGIALFFVSFLPQFVDSRRGSVTLQLALLGLIFTLTGTLYMTLLAFSAGSVGEYLRRAPRVASALRWLTGLTFIGLGLQAALSARR